MYGAASPDDARRDDTTAIEHANEPDEIDVSVLLPARNVAATVEAAIRSVLTTAPPRVEVVVVDDGSDDGTADVVAGLDDPRITLLVRPPRGIVAALNDGLARCRGRYIARMDGDDLAAPHRLTRQLPVLDADPRLAVIDGQVEVFRDDGPAPKGMRLWAEWINGVVRPEDFDRSLLIESPIVHPAATLRREAIDEVGGYRHGDFPEDYDLWLRLHAAGWRLAKIPEILVRMRDRPQRATRTDPRYRPAAFRTVRLAWLDATILARPRRLVLWGAGKAGRPWLRALLERGHDVAAVIDIDRNKIGRTRQGRVPVLGPEALAELDVELGLVAVGARGARAEIRDAIHGLRPSWREGQDWWAVC